MDFQLTSDQESLVSAVDTLATAFEHKPTEFHGFALYGKDLERELEDAQYFDIASVPELGPLCAAMAVERLARLPFTVECALSMLVRPQIAGGELPRPFSVIENGRPGRFATTAKTLLIIEGDKVGIAHPNAGDVEEAESVLAYPMGRLRKKPDVEQLAAADAANARKWLRIALAAEASGLMHAAINSTVEHLTLRKQFGRPLGSFQALRHRMAECTVLAGGVRWLMLKAAYSASEGDAALAAFHAQDSATRICYEVHQMLGAMGMTLEHSLHLWTYRLKSLMSELGGRGGQASVVAQHCFDPAAA